MECQALHSQRFKKILLNLSSAVEVISLLTFCTLETPKQVCWQAAKIPDDQGLHCLLRQNQTYEKEISFWGGNYNI